MQKTIFVVDDSATNLTMAEIALEKNFRVITASSAAKMFVILKRILPDIILLDIEMPEMNGFDAMTQLKADPKTSKIPVVFLSAMDDTSIKTKCEEMGALGLITKPFILSDLLKLIESNI